MAKLSKIVASKRKPKFPCRQKNRCELCGRPRSFMRDFRMCRICFRGLSLRGMIPGITKSSW
jgi:small subunit ribosomal protein S14